MKIGVNLKRLIVDNLVTNTSGKILDAHEGKVLNDKFGGVSLVVGEDGKLGYVLDGADTVNPFSLCKYELNDYISANTTKKITCGFKPKQIIILQHNSYDIPFSPYINVYNEDYSTTQYYGKTNTNYGLNIGSASSPYITYLLSVDNDGFTIKNPYTEAYPFSYYAIG